MPYVMDQIRILRERLEVPVIAFVGAPFTLCSYLIEPRGDKSREVEGLKAFIYSEPEAWDRLATYWADHLAEFGIAQHEAGAAAVQVFDSWAGAFSPDDLRRYVLPHNKRILERLKSAGVPTIHFVTGQPGAPPADRGGRRRWDRRRLAAPDR